MNRLALALRLLLPASVLLAAASLHAFEKDAWIVAADQVRLRSIPSIKGEIITELSAGTVVRVLSQTKVRDTLNQAEPGAEWGFFWYEAITAQGKGWIYGKFLYRMNGDEGRGGPGKPAFAVNASVYSKRYLIDGKSYSFGIAVEDSIPAFYEQGLTGSATHALPFFLEEGKDRAILFKAISVAVLDLREANRDSNGKYSPPPLLDPPKLPYYLMLRDDYGVEVRIQGVTVTGDKTLNDQVLLSFIYSTQTTKGTGYLKARMRDGSLVVVQRGIHEVEGPEGPSGIDW